MKCIAFTSDGNKEPLVKDDEFRKIFAIPYKYGTYYEMWANETILLYKYKSNATTKYQDIPEDTWKRIDNISREKGVNDGRHAEQIMLEDIKEIQEYLAVQPDDYDGSHKTIHSIEVILSYSPCDKCSERLCNLKQNLEGKKKITIRIKDSNTVQENMSDLSLFPEVEEQGNIKIKITFSNFYDHLGSNGKSHMEGLKKLLKNGIKLDTFSDKNWQYLFNATGLVTERPWRQRRERDDKLILQYLERCVALEATEQYLIKKRLILQ